MSYKESLYCYCTWQVHKVYVQAPDVAWNKYLKPIAWKSIMIGWLQKKSILKWKQAI